jgi:hypothetical protein
MLPSFALKTEVAGQVKPLHVCKQQVASSLPVMLGAPSRKVFPAGHVKPAQVFMQQASASAWKTAIFSAPSRKTMPSGQLNSVHVMRQQAEAVSPSKLAAFSRATMFAGQVKVLHNFGSGGASSQHVGAS